MQRQRVAQVEHVAHLSVLEEAGVAFCRNLLNLPLHRWQQHFVFTGILVGVDLHAVQRGVYTGLTGELWVFGFGMCKDFVASLLRAVLYVPNQSRGIVALQGDDHLQRVAQVVVRQGIAQRLLALVLTANDASYEFDARLVVEVVAVFVSLEIYCRVVVLYVKALVGEVMVLLDSLHLVLAAQNAEVELTFEVGLHGSAGGMHLATVHFEAYSLNGDAGAFIHDQACEAHSAGDSERASLLVVRLGIEGYIQTALALFGKVVVRHFAHRQLVGTLLVAPVGQFLYDVES